MALIRRVHVPLLAPEDVIPHLGAPHHWKVGRSAKCLVDQWWSANAIPLSVTAILDQDESLRGATLVDAFVERCTNLNDGRPTHSQSDLLAIVALADRLAVIGIEAKVDEGFDKRVADWLKDGSPGKQKRLAKLCAMLGLQPDQVQHLRYQLFHRTASAVLEARRYRVRDAAIIVQSWSPEFDGLEDFTEFTAALGVPLRDPGLLSAVKMIDGINVRFGWVAETVD